MKLKITNFLSPIILVALMIVLLVSCHSARWTNHNTPEQDAAFLRLLQSEDPEAMYQMGFFHFAKPGILYYPNGTPVAEEDKDYGGAIKWFKKAAGKGHIGAMIQAAALYRGGAGVVRRDPVEAVYWYKQAFQNGERNSSPFWLGDYYMRGEGGVSQDFQKALYYFNHSYGSYSLEKLLSRNELSTEVIPIDSKFAIYGASALRIISLFYRCGWGVSVETEKADKIIQQCAKYLDNPWCKRDAKRGPPACKLPSNNETLDD